MVIGVPVLKKLGKYEIRRELGRGSMGIVYEGFDPYIERTVAIKTIQKSVIAESEMAEVFSRFRREAQAAGRLTHPNIVAIYEYGEENDVAFIAMELLAGVELKEYFDKKRRFDANDRASIMFQLLDALEYSHGRGVVHRDIKPSNILITPDGRIKIADFGIARIESSDLTTIGTVMGTPAYMSPEQFKGLEADRRSDIYSAGVILYQLLTGEKPFTGSSMNAIMYQVINQAPMSPSGLNPEVTRSMDDVVKKALAKRPEDRFQTAVEFKEALEPVFASTIKPVSKKLQQGSNGRSAEIAFNQSDFDGRLQKIQQDNIRPAANSARSKEPVKVTPANSPASPDNAKQGSQQEVKPESGLLARLAREANEKVAAKQVTEHENLTRDGRVHDALERIIKFFIPFIQHVNNMEPAINRAYRLDAGTIFTKLKWRGATVDFRKQSLSDKALLAYVEFGVKLCSSEPVLIKRSWSQFETLKKELQHLRLRTLDDLDDIYKKPKQEWLEARLEPSFPVQIRFQGNYEHGKIEVTMLNTAYFGKSAFRLEPGDITSALMDNLGLFLIGGTNELPSLLR